MHSGVGGRRLAAAALVLLAVVPGVLASRAAAAGRGSGPQPTGPGNGKATTSWPPSPGMGKAGCGAYTTQHPHWTCSFDDEFSAKTHDANRIRPRWWRVQTTADSGYFTGPSGLQACYFNHPQNVWVANGSLHLRARREAHRFQCLSADGLGWLLHDHNSFITQYSAGMVSTWKRFSQEYGRFAVRAKMPATTTNGLQETLWLWPVNPKRYGNHELSGEIDFAEFYSRFADLTVPKVHYLKGHTSHSAGSSYNTASARCPIHRGKFNTYVLRWSPGRLTMTVNNTHCLTDNYHAANLKPPAPFDQPFMIVLTQALGIGRNAFNPRYTPLPATTTVDWVRIWKRN